MKAATPGGGVSCGYCRKTLEANVLQLRCARTWLCHLCYASRVRIGTHRPWDGYTVNTNLNFAVFAEEWTAHEELLLLDGILQFGLGNWKDMAEQLGLQKNERRCAEHYWDGYTGRMGAVLPLETRLRDGTRVTTAVLAPEVPLGTDTYERESFAASKVGRPEGGRPAEGGQGPGAKQPGDKAKLPGSDIHGYMPLRGEFDVEHDNDAELLLADMQFEDDEPAADVALKLDVIRVYNRKLDERQKRKEFVHARGLLDYRRVLNAERRRPKDERDIVSRMRPFARFHTAEDHEELVEKILRAKRLKRRIEELQYYRSLGISSLAEAAVFEQSQRKYWEAQRARTKSENTSYLYPSQTARRRAPVSPDSAPEPPAETEASHPVDSDPTLQLLSAPERQLCRELRLESAQQYLILKDAVIKKYANDGKSAPPLVEAPETSGEEGWSGADAKAFDYWVSCGWLSTAPGPDAGNAPPPKRKRFV